MGKYCYITLLGTDEYVDGVIGLYYNLKELGSKYPLIVMCFDNLKKETIQRLKDLQIEIRYIQCDTFGELSGHSGCCNNIITINKFQIFNFTEFDKICFLDADIILYFNLDYIFKYKYPVAHTGTWGGGAGGLFTIIPEKGKYEWLKEKYGPYCSNDEQIQNILYLEEYMLNCSLISYDYGMFYHMGGIPKYWDKLNLHTNDSLEKFMKMGAKTIARVLWHGYRNKKKTV